MGSSASHSIGLSIGLPLGKRSPEDMSGRGVAMILLQRANIISITAFEGW